MDKIDKMDILLSIRSIESPFTQSTSLFLKRCEGVGERGKTSFPARSAGCGYIAAASLALIDSVKSPFTQSTPLFLKGREGFGERGKTSFPVKRSFPSLPSLPGGLRDMVPPLLSL